MLMKTMGSAYFPVMVEEWELCLLLAVSASAAVGHVTTALPDASSTGTQNDAVQR